MERTCRRSVSQWSMSFSGSHEVVDYMTLSSDNIDYDNLERPQRLHEWLTKDDIEKLQNKFMSARHQKLSYPELRDALAELNIRFTDFEYNRLFLKINQNNDFKCDWSEFISYLILGFQEDDPSTQKESLILPISGRPLVRKSEHRSAVCAVSLFWLNISKEPDGFNEPKPTPDEDSSELKEPPNMATDTSDHSGMWITASKEGQIRFWDSSLQPMRTGMSTSTHLKTQTYILAITALSDVNVVCTASTERELRFHDIIASTFPLRLVVRSLPFAVCAMTYRFHAQGSVLSRLVLGDFGGNCRIIEFSPFLRGPFQSKPGSVLVEVFYSDLLKGKIPLIHVREFLNIHAELIQFAYYSLRMNSLFAAAEYRNTKTYRGRCPGLIVANGEDKTIFRIPLGVTSFFVDESNNIVVTGGPDTFVRIWDVYIPSKPSAILTGHNGGIVKIFVQPDEKKVYSVDYQKIIKVWHLTEHTLLQTYGDLVHLIPSETDLCYHYHTESRELLVGGRKLISIKCSPRVRVDLTDGNTHAQPVSVVLYNRLFRNIVTCGLDSYIIVWDPWTGRRKIMMKSCHTRVIYGEIIDIEITAACFDPLEQFLLTGARDGSLKIWNYNNAVCIRNMSIKKESEVTAVIWVVGRILAVGWDKQVTEFNDVEGREYGDPKIWPKFHSDDVTCADVKLGEGVVTATHSGEIIFWKLETGQPYRRYDVTRPKEFIPLQYTPEDDLTFDALPHIESQNLNVMQFNRKSISGNIRALENEFLLKSEQTRSRLRGLDSESYYLLSQKSNSNYSPTSVQSVLFLQTRPMRKDYGTVLVSLEKGVIQVYSHHQRGGYIKEFNAVHKTGDCVLAMATDRKNRYLLTGTAFGYIKIWYIENYCIPDEEKKPISMPKLRLQFMFLRKERFVCRAKRVIRMQPEPMLVNCFKGHLKAISSIAYVNLPKIVITGSYDCSVRLWTLGGRYLGTLGTPLPWMKLSPFQAPFEEKKYRLPPDIQKVASSTTLKVISGTAPEHTNVYKAAADKTDEPEEDDGEISTIFGKPLQDPVLGKHFKLPGKSVMEQRIKLDVTAAQMQVFTHLKIHPTTSFKRPTTPPIMQQIANEDYMDFYKAPTDKIEESTDERTNRNTFERRDTEFMHRRSTLKRQIPPSTSKSMMQ